MFTVVFYGGQLLIYDVYGVLVLYLSIMESLKVILSLVMASKCAVSIKSPWGVVKIWFDLTTHCITCRAPMHRKDPEMIQCVTE